MSVILLFFCKRLDRFKVHRSCWFAGFDSSLGLGRRAQHCRPLLVQSTELEHTYLLKCMYLYAVLGVLYPLRGFNSSVKAFPLSRMQYGRNHLSTQRFFVGHLNSRSEGCNNLTIPPLGITSSESFPSQLLFVCSFSSSGSILSTSKAHHGFTGKCNIFTYRNPFRFSNSFKRAPREK